MSLSKLIFFLSNIVVNISLASNTFKSHQFWSPYDLELHPWGLVHDGAETKFYLLNLVPNLLQKGLSVSDAYTFYNTLMHNWCLPRQLLDRFCDFKHFRQAKHIEMKTLLHLITVSGVNACPCVYMKYSPQKVRHREILTTNPKLWIPFKTLRKGPFLTSHKSPDWNVNSLDKPYFMQPSLKFSIFVMATNGDITFFWNWTGCFPSAFNNLLMSLKKTRDT